MNPFFISSGSVHDKPNDPPSDLVMTRFYTFTSAIFHVRYLIQPPDRGEYEFSNAIGLLI